MNITIILLEATCTFAILSYLYKENFVFRIFENVFIGISVGHICVMAIGTIRNSAIQPLLNGDFIYIIPLILGLSLYFFFSKNYFYIYRFPMSILIGGGLGIAVRGMIHSNILQQIGATITLMAPGNNLISILNGLVIIVGVFSALYYFTFTLVLERKGISGGVMRLARYLMMAAFGASFASGIMTRTAYLSGRLMFLWSPQAMFTIAIAAVLFIAGIYYDTRLRK